ncbi:hypothetical protein BGX38DRAFT_1140382 [Terfezia claveryi]|nr:hypothetical protein BGX38DRAFT_1140382 [Terfezia claveryi]
MSLNPLQSAALHPLPIPIEASRRSNRTNKFGNTTGLFQPQVIETTRRSNRTTLQRKVEDVLSEAPSRAASRAPTRASSPVQGEKKSLASSIFFPKASPVITTGTQTPQTPDYFSIQSTTSTASKPNVTSLQFLPQPVETTRRSNRKPVPKAPDNETPPPTPPPQVETAPSNSSTPFTFAPKPFEVSRRSNRPLARPLQTVKAEEAPKSNLSRKPEMQLDLSRLPQPVSTSRWTNKINKPGARHLRRSSTVQPPGTPGNYYFVPETGQASETPMNRTKEGGRGIRPEDHVEHFAGAVDSTPASPNGSPNQSRCPSLSTSPTSSTDNLPLDSKGNRGVCIDGRRDSLEEGYASYILDAQRRKKSGERRPRSPKSPKSPGASGLRQTQNIDDTTTTTTVKPIPVPIASKNCRRDSEAPDNTAMEKEKEYLRAKARGETVKPMKVNIPAPPANKVYDEYPIFASPTRENFLPKPERVATKDLPTAKPIPIPNMPSNTGNLPTPPDSNPNSSQATMLSFGKLKIPVVGLFYPSSIHNYHHPSQQLTPHNPSPGITVASLPPKREMKAIGSPMVPLKPTDVTDQFVGEVWRYLSFEHECIARRYDEELSEGTGWRKERVSQDRWGALREYVKMWVGVNPEVDGGERMKGGLW